MIYTERDSRMVISRSPNPILESRSVYPFLFFIFLFGTLYGKQLLTLEDDFELLTGKNTQLWSHLQTKEDFSQLKYYKELYEENKELQFNPGQTSYKIPKIVHFIWLGPKNFPRQSISNIRSWMALHPDWTFLFWTDLERPCPCPGMQRMLVKEFPFANLEKEYDAATNFAEKSDILRYEILSQFGGIYSDHDVQAITSFDKLNQSYDFFAGLEVPLQKIAGFSLAAGNGLIGARPHHPVLEKCLRVVKERWEEVYETYCQNTITDEVARVMNGSYIALTYAIQSTLEKDDNVDILFPAAYFNAQEELPSFYSKHFFEGTWVGSLKKTPFQKTWTAENKEMRKLLRYHMILQFTCLVMLILYFKRKKARA